MTGTHRFDVVASETVYRGKILTLRVDEVTMPGDVVARREIVEHQGAVATVAVDDRNRIALVRQYRHAMADRMLELPAGMLDGGPDESPVEAAQRELVEEIGFRAETWGLLVDIAASPGFTDEAIRVFVATDLTEVGRPPVTGDEEADLTVEWIDADTVADMVFAGEITNATTAAGILAYLHGRSRGAAPRPVEAPWPQRPSALAHRARQG